MKEKKSFTPARSWEGGHLFLSKLIRFESAERIVQEFSSHLLYPSTAHRQAHIHTHTDTHKVYDCK